MSDQLDGHCPVRGLLSEGKALIYKVIDSRVKLVQCLTLRIYGFGQGQLSRNEYC